MTVSVSAFTVGAVACFPFLITLFINFMNNNDLKPFKMTRYDVCKSEAVIIYIQRAQFERAQQEILNLENCSNFESQNGGGPKSPSGLHEKSLYLFKKEIIASKHKTDGLFYAHNFGGVEVLDTSCVTKEGRNANSKCKRLGYYNIWKNGNEYIRSLMYRYAHKFNTPGEHLRTKPFCKLGNSAIDLVYQHFSTGIILCDRVLCGVQPK